MIPELFATDADALVAYGAPGPKTVADTIRDAAAIATALPEGRRRILVVFESDRQAFVAALFAIFARGHVAVIPPDTRRSTLLRLRETCDAVLHDTHSGLRHRVADLLEANPDVDVDATARAIRSAWSEGRAQLELGGRAIDSNALGAELSLLQAALPWRARRVACTAPVGHRYGLVWGVLRPMIDGAAFARTMANRSAFDADTLVTVPHHLGSPLLGVANVTKVISSMGSLPRELAERWPDVDDVFTTSTVGALAHRAAGAPRFTLLPDRQISVTDAGTMRIEAPEHHPTLDVVTVDERGFEITGHADRRVFVGDRDFDLEAIASHVRGLQGVDDAGAVPGTDDAPVFVAVASATAVRASLEVELERQLGGRFADVTVTRVLPRDALGRLPRADVLVLFGRGPDGAPRSFDLEWGPSNVDDVGHHFELRVPENYRWFDGHFDRYPVLPAAVQLNRIVLPCVARSGLVDAALCRAERLKFSGRIGPGDTLRVTIVAAKPGELRFEIAADGRSCSSGRLRFGEATRT